MMRRRSFFSWLLAGVAAAVSLVYSRKPSWFRTCPRDECGKAQLVYKGWIPICRADVLNGNGRVYTRKALEDIARRLEGVPVPVVLASAVSVGDDTWPVHARIGNAILRMEGGALVAQPDPYNPSLEYRTWTMAIAEERGETLVVTKVDEFVAVLAHEGGKVAELDVRAA